MLRVACVLHEMEMIQMNFTLDEIVNDAVYYILKGHDDPENCFKLKFDLKMQLYSCCDK